MRKEFAVGQKWRTRGGKVVTITDNIGFSTKWPWTAEFKDGTIITLDNDGLQFGNKDSTNPNGLVDLIKPYYAIKIDSNSAIDYENHDENPWVNLGVKGQSITSDKSVAKDMIKTLRKLYPTVTYTLIKFKA